MDHVLMTADAVGGVWTYALDLARGLARDGVRTTLAVLGEAPQPDQSALAAAVPGLELIHLGGALDWTAQSPADVDVAGIQLAMLAARLRPDIVHLNSPALAANARFPAPLVQTCHSCVKTWWAAVRGDAVLPDDLAWRAQMTGRGYAAADALIAPTEAFARATQAAYALAAAPRVVRNGRSPAQAGAAATAPGDFIFTAGRLWDEGKGVEALDRAAGRVSTPVFAAGDLAGPNGAQIALANARSLGRLSEAEIAERLAARPIFVSTALYEPFGLAVLEAAQAGCALVLSDIDSLHELWDGCALFVSPTDDAQIAATLERLATDPAERARLSAAANARAADFSVEAMVAGTLAAYRDTLSAMGRAA